MAYLSRKGHCAEPECREQIFASGLCANHRRRKRLGLPSNGAWKQCETCTTVFKPHGRQRWCAVCVPNFDAYVRLVRYGLTDPQYQELLFDQEYACAICREEVSLVVDHCHATKRVRGLLCYGCNLRLSALDQEGWLDKALKYVKGGDRSAV